MEPITLGELKEAVHGELIGDFRDESVVITGAKSDNRTVAAGDVFFAFVGEKTDGHRFVKAALESGAAGAVISRVPGGTIAAGKAGECSDGHAADTSGTRVTGSLNNSASEDLVPGKFYVLVKDTIQAAGDLARWYRGRFNIPVVGVTGSVGKTTTKDMIASVLSVRFRTVKTEGNFNNSIGLPRTVLRLSHDTEMAVIEMGMNHRGEIDYLTRIAQPTAATITNIGEAHIGNLGSKENIFRAKCEIFHGLADGGFVVLNGDDEYLTRLREGAEKSGAEYCIGTENLPAWEDEESAERKVFHITYVGEAADCDWRAVDIQDDLEECMKFTAVTPVGTFPVTVPAPGHHLIYPALTAAAIGAHYGLTVEEIRKGIAGYVPTKLRMEAKHLAGNIVIYNDTYNANPQSMKSGLLTLSHNKASRKVAVLGDMFELGDAEETLHRGVGAYAAGLGLTEVITVGKAAHYIAEAAREAGDAGKDAKDVREAVTSGENAGTVREAGKGEVTSVQDSKKAVTKVTECADREQAKAAIRDAFGPDTAWLFKASHGMQLGELAEFAESLYSD